MKKKLFNSYEIIYMFRPVYFNAEINIRIKNYEERLKSSGAFHLRRKGKKESFFKKRRLSYPIRKYTAAYNCVIKYQAQSFINEKLFKLLKYDETIIRYSIFKICIIDSSCIKNVNILLCDSRYKLLYLIVNFLYFD